MSHDPSTADSDLQLEVEKVTTGAGGGASTGPRSRAAAAQHSAAEVPAAAEEAAGDEAEQGATRRFLIYNAVPSWMTSMLVHMVLLLFLAMLTLPNPRDLINELVLGTEGEADDIEELEQNQFDLADLPTVDDVTPSTDVTVEEPVITPADDLTAAQTQIELSENSDEFAPQSELLKQFGALSGNDLAGRGTAKARLLRDGGGTKGSEDAVSRALQWFARHQLPDGGWSFDHRLGSCQGRCPNEGTHAKARNAATAMALLPFLGAGETHVDGKYEDVVKAGLAFLVRCQTAFA